MNRKTKNESLVPKSHSNSIFYAAIPKLWLLICAAAYSAYVLLQFCIDAYGYVSRFMLDLE